MTTEYTDNPLVVSNAIKALVVANKDELGIQDVFYGDQQRIPKSPTVCVEPSSRAKDFNGTGMRATHTFTCSLFVYEARLGDINEIQASVDQLAYDLATLLDEASKDKTTDLGGLVAWGYCSELDFGYRVKANQLMRADRIVWTGYNEMCLA